MASHKNILLIIILVLSSFICLCGQDDPLLRIEIPAKSTEAKFRLVPADNQGLLFFYQTTLKEDNYKFWVFQLYDRYLQDKWKTDIPLFSNMIFADQTVKDGYLYCFFHDAEKKKSEEYNFQILKLEIKSGRYEMFSGLLPDKTLLVDFEVMNELALIGLNLERGAGVYSFDMDTRTTKIVFDIT